MALAVVNEPGHVVWITGLPSSGKTTLARALRAALGRAGKTACLLDGDDVRDALVPRPGYDSAGRADFYETLARLAALVARQGVDVIVSATANREAYRQRARQLAPRFLEVLVATPEGECERRDPKGLWAAAAAGAIAALPGSTTEYELPRAPDFVATGGHDASAVDRIVSRLLAR